MSFSLESVNNPSMVLASSGLIVWKTPALTNYVFTTLGTSGMIYLNAAAFGMNVLSVSLPGRLDGSEAELEKRKEQKEKVTEEDEIFIRVNEARKMQLINPSGWAFAIWGVIYLGELAFVSIGQYNSPSVTQLLPRMTAPFVAANLFQSLWCATFRPKYYNLKKGWWQKYISAAMLGGTTYYLSQVHSIVRDSSSSSLWFVPTTIHFGWCTAATLLNLNGAVALDCSLPGKDSIAIAVGHISAIVATAIGTGVTYLTGSSAYGATIAWALAACKDGMKKRVKELKTGGGNDDASLSLLDSFQLQEKLCLIGSSLCAAVSIYKGVIDTNH